MRELTRQVKNASKLVPVVYSDHCNRAKRKAWAIRNAKRQKQRVPLYRDLVKVTKKTIGYARQSIQSLQWHKHDPDSIQKMIELALQVVDQTERRVFAGESVPTGSSLAIDMMKRHEELFGQPAEQAALDGGFATKDNLSSLKAMQIQDLMFSKRVGLAISNMVQEAWIHKKLRDFRAGIEGIISFLKRAFGLSRCRFRGLRSFKS